MALSRRQARRQALMLLYQWDLSGQEIGSQYAGEIDAWARGVAEAVAAHAAALDERITARRMAGPPIDSARSNGARCGSRCTSSTRARCRRKWRSTRRWHSRSGTRRRMRLASSTGSSVVYNGRRHDGWKNH